MNIKNSLIDILKEFSIDEIMLFEKKYDEQYKALEYLYKNIKNKKLFLKLITANALVSYQLTNKGEEYWWAFSKYFSKANIKDDYKILCEEFRKFLLNNNKRFSNTKQKRVCKFLEKINYVDIENFCESGLLSELLKLLSNIMNQKEDSKTMVFAVKIFGYGCRILGYRIIYPDDMFIPIDVRISKISTSKQFWIDIKEKTKIPLLHIDSILWVTKELSYKDIYRIPDIGLRNKILKIKKILDS